MSKLIWLLAVLFWLAVGYWAANRVHAETRCETTRNSFGEHMRCDDGTVAETTRDGWRAHTRITSPPPIMWTSQPRKQKPTTEPCSATEAAEARGKSAFKVIGHQATCLIPSHFPQDRKTTAARIALPATV